MRAMLAFIVFRYEMWDGSIEIVERVVLDMRCGM